MNYEAVSLWVAVVSLVVAAASFVVSLIAIRVAKSSLLQTEQVAERGKRDWKQMKWFDLYFAASEACDSLEHFQKRHGTYPAGLRWNNPDIIGGFNELMFHFRRVGSLAMVFPKSPAIDRLIASVKFADHDEAFSTCRLSEISNAVEDMRMKALVHTSVLE